MATKSRILPVFVCMILSNSPQICHSYTYHTCSMYMIYFSVNQPLPSDKVKRALQLFWINDILVKFLIAQGAKLSAVKPVFLMDFNDFEVYVKEIGDKKLMNISRDTYEIISGSGLPKKIYNNLYRFKICDFSAFW